MGIGTASPDAFVVLDKDVSTAYDATDDAAQRTGTNTLLLTNEDGTANSFAQIAFDLSGANQSIARIVGINDGPSTSALAFVTEGSNTKREAMRLDGSGNALIGTTAVTGSLSNTKRVTGGIFSTNNGTTSVPNATWTTLTAIPTGDAIYLVTAYLPNSGDPAGYNAVSIVTTSLTGTNLVDIKNANQVALRMSGSNLQVNHGQGTTQPINWSILRLA